MKAIDQFYEEPENRLIRVIDALEISAARQRGVPESVIANRILMRRRAADRAPERK